MGLEHRAYIRVSFPTLFRRPHHLHPVSACSVPGSLILVHPPKTHFTDEEVRYWEVK